MDNFDEYDLAGLNLNPEQKLKAKSLGITPQMLLSFRDSFQDLPESIREMSERFNKSTSDLTIKDNKTKNWNKKRFYN